VKSTRLVCLTLFSLAAVGLAPSAWGWGCKGHQIVALLAEKNLNPHARAMAMQILAGSPISPDLRRYCGDSGLDPFAGSSTWADDERSVERDTGGWHFIDIPLGVSQGSLTKYCPPSTGCVTSAITAQLVVLRNPDATPQEKADALRYVIHFLGDLHQPLHTTTNNDLGGNCVPVEFEGRVPEETNAESGSYRPNLHGVWDSDIIEHFTHGETPEQVADELENRFKAQIAVWKSQPVDLSAWVWESHRIAEDTVYGRLPVRVPIETPREVHSCADDDHVSNRMLELHEQLGESYITAVEPTIQEQLAKAGVRLADVLNSLWQ
jgi:hypothetical protein